jgi:hypothetical protein
MWDTGVYVQVAPTADRYIGIEGPTTEPGPGGNENVTLYALCFA